MQYFWFELWYLSFRLGYSISSINATRLLLIKHDFNVFGSPSTLQRPRTFPCSKSIMKEAAIPDFLKLSLSIAEAHNTSSYFALESHHFLSPISLYLTNLFSYLPNSLLYLTDDCCLRAFFVAVIFFFFCVVEIPKNKVEEDTVVGGNNGFWTPFCFLVATHQKAFLNGPIAF